MHSKSMRQVRSIRRSLPRHALLTLIRVPAVGKLDYCNSVPTAISGHVIDRLQSVINATARLIFSARRSDHITPHHCSVNSVGADPVPAVCWRTAASSLRGGERTFAPGHDTAVAVDAAIAS